MKKLIVILMTLVMMLSFAGCGGNSEIDNSTPDAAAKTFMTALSNQDEDALSEVYMGKLELKDPIDLAHLKGNKDWEAASDEMLAKMLEFEYELGEPSEEGDKATIKVTASTYSAAETFTTYIERQVELPVDEVKNMTEDEIAEITAELFVDCVKNQKEKTVSFEAELELVKEDGAWKITEKSGKEFIEKLYG